VKRTVGAGVRAFAPALLCALALCGCGAPAPARHVLLITIDTLRPDRLSCYGYAAAKTPGIDRLAAEGARFAHVLADAPWTTPSLASVLTGTYATTHGLKSTSVHRLRDESLTLAEILAQHGYATSAIVGSFPVDSIYHLDQGFAHYDDAFTKPIWIFPDHVQEHVASEQPEKLEDRDMHTLLKAANDSRRDDSEVTDAALAWLDTRPDQPFFLWLHYFGPHGKPDWRLPEDERGTAHQQGYDAELAETDHQVARLLEGLDTRGLAHDTLVVLHADHGESLGEQHYVGHGWLLNEASLRIPLLVRLPGRIEAGKVAAALARNVDILPTVLDAVHVEAPPGLAGESLLPRVAAPRFPWQQSAPEAVDPKRTAYLESYFAAHHAFAKPVTLPDGTQIRVGLVRRGVQTERWKYVRTEAWPLFDVPAGQTPEIPESVRRAEFREDLFDLQAPSGDDFDVSAQYPQVLRTLRAELDKRLAEEARTKPAPAAPLDPEMRKRLEALGYGD
jgi:arylsulfatase A-like enzyme